MIEQDSLPRPRSEESGDSLPLEFRRVSTIQDLFASRVEERPNATALIHLDSRLSFAEVEAQSEFYASCLEEAGIGPGHCVPVVVRRSPSLVALMLAVLKRGAAYAAMDPSWPVSRLAGMIERLDAPLVITDTDTTWPAPSWTPPAYDPSAPARRPAPVPVSPDDAAIIVFTSGSTGQPKGVLIPHRAIVRLYNEYDWMPLGPGMVSGSMSQVSWDGFSIDCLGPLLTGSTVVLVDPPELSPLKIREMTEQYGINTMFVTPTLFNVIVDEGVEAFTGWDTVFIGGETASPAHCRRFLEGVPGTRLVNLYGPAESGLMTTRHEITVADCLDGDGVPVGVPVPHTGVHVLDGESLCEAGEHGEICMSGPGVALGYLGDPEETARKFVEVDIDGVRRRVYRTGDAGHWADDQLLRFGGRLDRQVKVHGYRIEPEEIERVAAQIPGVSMTAVVPIWGDNYIDLLALFYASPEANIKVADLEAELRRLLPVYLVPRRIRRLDRFPLLPNGKVDRQMMEAFVASEAPAPPPATPDDAPRGATEIAIAAIFAEILGISQVSRAVSILELGGDSLTSAWVSARLERTFGRKVPVSQVYRTPTVAKLAEWFDATSAGSAEPAAGPARDAGRLIPLPPMMKVMLPTQLTSKIAWWMDRELDNGALQLAADDIHRRHQALQARYLTAGTDAGHAVLPEDPGRARFLLLPPAPTDTAAIEAFRSALDAPFAIEDGEVWRWVVISSSASGRKLVGVAGHHVAFDGWSMQVLGTELPVAYAARLAGKAPQFGAPVAALADFDSGYRAQLAATDLDAQRAYWAGEFKGLRPCHFPGRSAGPVPMVGPDAASSCRVDSAQIERWKAYGRDHGMTPFVWTAAACTEALVRAGARPDLAFLVTTTNHADAMIDRSVTSRVGLACLRPNGPSRAGGHLLARMHDAYSQAMAATDLLLDPAEASVAAGLRPTDPPPLQALPNLVYQDRQESITLGGVVGEPVLDLSGPVASRMAYIDVTLEIATLLDDGLQLTVYVRSDLYPAELGEEICGHFRDVISAGPAGLEEQAAS